MFIKNLVSNIGLEGTARYTGQLAGPPEGFGLWPIFVCPAKKRKKPFMLFVWAL